MKIEHFRPCDKGGALKASFQASFDVPPWGEWNVNMTFFQKDSGETWFGYPQRQYTSQQGERKFFKLSYPHKEAREGFEKDVRSALARQVPAMKDLMAEATQQEGYMPYPLSNEPLPF